MCTYDALLATVLNNSSGITNSFYPLKIHYAAKEKHSNKAKDTTDALNLEKLQLLIYSVISSTNIS